MPHQPLVSIVTPLYNQKRFIEETLHSVLSQSYDALEYIVVNDGSTDGSRAVLDKYSDRITIVDQPNSGQARALNHGWSISKGTYIGYLSSDDILAHNCVEQLVARLEADEGVVCAYPNCNLISPASELLKRGVSRPFDLEELIGAQECHIGPGALWRASTHRLIGGWRPELKLAPDREYWMRLAAHGRFYFETQELAGYRLHPGSISSSTTSEEVSLEYVHVLEEYFKGASIPESLLARKGEAFANAYWLIARNMLREGNIGAATRYLRHAHLADPSSSNLNHIATLIRSSVGKPLRHMAGWIRRAVGA